MRDDFMSDYESFSDDDSSEASDDRDPTGQNSWVDQRMFPLTGLYPRFWKQTTIVPKGGSLALGPPLHRPRSSHVAGHGSLRPRSATTDLASTSFLRFPPEIRLVIYRKLLLRGMRASTAYKLCPITLRFWLEDTRDNRHLRHGRPRRRYAILQCCRLMYGEAITILYDNSFRVESPRKPVLNYISLTPEVVQLVTRLDFPALDETDRAMSQLRTSLDPFQALKELRLFIVLTVKGIENFLRDVSTVLERAEKVKVAMCVTFRQFEWISKNVDDSALGERSAMRIATTLRLAAGRSGYQEDALTTVTIHLACTQGPRGLELDLDIGTCA